MSTYLFTFYDRPAQAWLKFLTNSYYCEYCLLPANLSFFAHEIDHIIAEKHGGKTEANNLAYTCWRCNRYKYSK